MGKKGTSIRGDLPVGDDDRRSISVKRTLFCVGYEAPAADVRDRCNRKIIRAIRSGKARHELHES